VWFLGVAWLVYICVHTYSVLLCCSVLDPVILVPNALVSPVGLLFVYEVVMRASNKEGANVDFTYAVVDLHAHCTPVIHRAVAFSYAVVFPRTYTVVLLACRSRIL
jgi:hypothetical protein